MEARECDELDEAVDGAARGRQVVAQRPDAALGARVVEHREVDAVARGAAPVDLLQPALDLIQRHGIGLGGDDALAEGVDVGRPGDAAHEVGLQGGGAATGEGVEDDVAGLAVALDEPLGQLRLEAGAVADDVVQGMHLALAGGPELTGELRDRAEKAVAVAGSL